MKAVVVLSGRMGAGKSTLLRALLENDPDYYRCLTVTTTRRPKPSDVMHPKRMHWSEYCYVSEQSFRFWLDRAHFAAAVADDGGEGHGLLCSTVANALTFDGCVVANVPVSFFKSYTELFSLYQRSVTGIFVDVDDELLIERMLRRGNSLEHARMNLQKSIDWPEQAAKLGYTFIGNPEEPDGHPHRAVRQALAAIQHAQVA